MIDTQTDVSAAIAGGDFQQPQSPDTPDVQLVASEEDTVNEVKRKYDIRRQMRRPYEIQWYQNASALRGFPDVRFNAELNRLEIKREPQHRKRFRINLLKSKYIARLSKFLRMPSSPIVLPATTDREDIMNAKASQKALEYAIAKFGLKKLYRQVMRHVPVTGKAFLWVRWNEEAVGSQLVDGKPAPIMGDIAVDFGDAFEFLPADPGIENLEDQPEIMRAKMVLVKDIIAAHPDLEGQIHGESNEADIFFYQRQIADLGTRQQGMASRATQQMEDSPSYALRLELFTKPCPEYPNGRYVVVAGNKMIRYQDSLPGGFSTCHRNPYPVIEFVDDVAPGQFWPDAFVERLIGIQSEYNEYRSKIGENLTLHFFPHLLSPIQANLGQTSYTNEAGQIIEYTAVPNIDKPSFLQPSGVLGDAWNILQFIKQEFDDISMITPAVLGSQKGANSGYQVNLLQEAADTVHLPTIEHNADCLTELFIKIRRLMKIGYDQPRLVAVAGRNNIPDVAEFSRDNIDETAEVRVEVSDMMPVMRSARIDMIRGMFKDGLFGDPMDPKTRKKTNEMLRTTSQEFELDREARDEEQAQRENLMMERAEPLPRPFVWENHEVHWDSHTDLFKSPETLDWTPEQWKVNVWHVVNHLQYINPLQGLMLAAEFGLQNEAMQLQQIYLAVAAQNPAVPGANAPNPQDPNAPQGQQEPGQPPPPPVAPDPGMAG